jgi:hypothetical protein
LLIAARNIQARVLGPAATMSAIPDLSGGYLVLPRQALGNAAPLPTVLLVAASDLSQAALAAAVAQQAPGGTVVFRSRLLAGLQGEPLQHGAYLALAIGGAAAGCCGLLVLLLSLLLSASARQLAFARMSTMGLSVGQARVAAMVELLPQLLAALAGGLACAGALVPLTAPALSLGIFTGSASRVPVRIEPSWLVVAGLGLLVLEVGVLAGQSVLADRGAPRLLRMGE